MTEKVTEPHEPLQAYERRKRPSSRRGVVDDQPSPRGEGGLFDVQTSKRSDEVETFPFYIEY